MPVITEDKSGCMILYALKFIQFVARDTSKKRVTVVYLEKMRETERSSRRHLK